MHTTIGEIQRSKMEDILPVLSRAIEFLEGTVTPQTSPDSESDEQCCSAMNVDTFSAAMRRIQQALPVIESFEKDAVKMRLCSFASDAIRSYFEKTASLHNDGSHAADNNSWNACTDGVDNSTSRIHDQRHRSGGDDEANSTSVSSNFRLLQPQSINVHWRDIVGAERAVAGLKQAVVLPRKMPELFSGVRKPWGCILLYGPPGTGKTLLASAAAAEAGIPLIPISSSDLLSKWVGDTEKLIRSLFHEASALDKCIIFLDEIDALCSARGSGSESESSRRVKTEFLVRMQTVDPRRVTIMAATNLPWELDIAFRRRFDRLIYVGLPSYNARRELLQKYLSEVEHCLSSDDVDAVVDSLDGCSPCDIGHICHNAIMAPIDRLQRAEYFRCVGSPPSCDTTLSLCCGGGLHTSVQHVAPCDASCKGAFAATLDDLPPGLLAPLVVTAADFHDAIATFPKSVTQEYVAQYSAWEASLRNA